MKCERETREVRRAGVAGDSRFSRASDLVILPVEELDVFETIVAISGELDPTLKEVGINCMFKTVVVVLAYRITIFERIVGCAQFAVLGWFLGHVELTTIRTAVYGSLALAKLQFATQR